MQTALGTVTPPTPLPALPTETAPLLASIRAFNTWLSETGYASYDPYDIWGTRFGLFSRRLYYKRNPFGLPLIAPLVAMDLLWPSLRNNLSAKTLRHRRRPTHPRLSQPPPPDAGRRLPGKSPTIRLGPLGDQHRRLQRTLLGLPIRLAEQPRPVEERTHPTSPPRPIATKPSWRCTSTTGESHYLDIAASIAQFVSEDLNDTPTGKDAAAASYSPLDDTQVINASAYRAYVLFDAAARFDSAEYRSKAERNLNFILNSQRQDGSWLYALQASGEAFIDHFHTCFVLKNLWKIHTIHPRKEIKKAVQRGYDYYRAALFHSDDSPRHFAIPPRFEIVRLEMYDFAEAITLGVLLRDLIPEAFTLAQALADQVIQKYQLPDGHFVTRVFKGGIRHTFPFLRWPQAQMFYALTNLLSQEIRNSKPEILNNTQ